MAGMEHNQIVALKGLIDDLVGLEREVKSAKEDRREELKSLRAMKLPAKQIDALLKLKAKDPEKLDEERQKLKQAAALLGMTVHVDESAPVPHGCSEAQVAVLTASVKVIEGLDGEIASFKEAIKEKYEAVEELGANKRVVKRIVYEVLNPPDDNDQSEFDALYDIYKEHLSRVVVVEPPKVEEEEETY